MTLSMFHQTVSTEHEESNNQLNLFPSTMSGFSGRVVDLEATGAS